MKTYRMDQQLKKLRDKRRKIQDDLAKVERKIWETKHGTEKANIQ